MEAGNIVYVVDSDEAIGEGLTALLGTYNIEVRRFADAKGFLDLVPTLALDHGCLLIEEKLTDQSGVSLVRQLREQGHNLPIILLTSTSNRDTRRQALKFGATDVLEKPLINAFLIERLTRLLPGTVPYTENASRNVELRDGTLMTIRTMNPDDADLEQAFVEGLSIRSRYLRFFSNIKSLTPRMLESFTHPSYPETNALVATVTEDGKERIVAVARYAPTEPSGNAEFAIVVADEWQGFGIANRLLRGLTVTAAIAGVQCLEGLVLKENHRMLELTRDLGFTALPYEGDTSVLRVIKQLSKPASQIE